jgi:nicotinate-nucleotide adenylyltransferase
MNLGLFGGSFNPPHNGHVELARGAMEKLRIDKLIWMPSGDPPHKTLPEGTPSAEHRLEMSRLAVWDLPNVETDDFEITSGTRYTADTVEALHARYRPDILWLLMGADMWESFHTWHRAGELERLVSVYVCPRTDISSTKVRAAMDGKDIPPKVWEYIRKEGLYGTSKP